MDPVTAVGLAASVVQILGAVGQLIKYVSDVRNASPDQARLAREIASFAVFLTNFSCDIQVYDLSKPEFAGFRYIASRDGPLNELMGVVNHLRSRLRIWGHLKRIMKSLAWPLDRQEVDNFLGLIHRLTTYIGTALAQDTVRLAVRIDSGVRNLQEHAAVQRKAKDFQTILKWISDLDFSKTHSDHLARCQPGSGRWFLEHETFEEWSSGPARTMWCHGQPGSGKTTLMSLTIDHFMRHGDRARGVAYLYFNYKDEHTQSAERMIASLLEQLVRGKEDIGLEVRSVYDRHRNTGARPPVSEISELLAAEAQSYSKTYIFVDALDECSRKDGNLEKFLTALRPVRRHAQVLITSRASSILDTTVFDGDLTVEIRASEADIRQYLEHRLQNEKRLEQLLNNDTDLQKSVVEKVTGNAEGMFLLAQLQMDFIARKNNRRDIRRSLDNLPRQLSDVYEAAFQRIANQSADDAKLAERVLCWIISAKRPLSRLEIQHALAVEPEDTDLIEEGILNEDILLGACAGLITIDTESSVVRLVHYTAQEYFKATFQTRLHRFGIEIASTCITYLCFDSLCAHLEHDLDQQFATYPLLRYAAQHWGHHAREALSRSGTSEEEIEIKNNPDIELLESKILTFCNDQTKIQSWYRAMFQIEHGYDMDPSSLAQITGIHVASGLGFTHVVASLLGGQSGGGRNIDLNRTDSNGETPLHWAASKGHKSVVNLLLSQSNCSPGGEISPDETNIKGKTPLRLAVENSHADVVRSLVTRDDIQLDREDDITAETALWRAADLGDAKAVAALLSVLDGGKGRQTPPLDVNAKDAFYGETPLLRAVERGHVDVVRELLARGGPDLDLQATDQFYEETPLERARAKGYGEIVSLLEEVTEKEAGGVSSEGRRREGVDAQ
ncbi:hypothetical protein V8F33_006264 [Rhypophila sp. PSN 637]